MATLQGHSNTVKQIAFSLDCKYLAFISLDESVKLWSIEEPNKVITLLIPSNPINTIALSPNKIHLAARSEINTV